MTKSHQLKSLLTLTLLCIAAVLFTSSCAEKDDVLLEEPEEEVVEEIIIPPKPDWDDGVMTITVGRFETKQDMLQELERKSADLYVGDLESLRSTILSESFTLTPPEKQYTITIAVVTMLEAGITEPATLQEIEDAYWDNGYTPVTREAAVELFLQFEDQPDSSTGHRMNNFRILTREGLEKVDNTGYYVYAMRHVKRMNRETKKRFGIGGVGTIDPLENYLAVLNNYRLPGGSRIIISPHELPYRFAVAVRGSLRRVR